MVGILTFHKAINYGAVLQAYALRSAIESFGHNCSVINYANPKMLKESKAFYLPKHQSIVDRALYLYRIPMRARQVKKFNSFLNNHLALSKKILTNSDDLKSISENYDAFVTGSDQVFNYKGTGEDFNFYLEFENDNSKKIAYAPSFGLSNIDDYHKDRVARCLSSFKALSVREDIGASLTEELTGICPPKVCDPTFLVDKEQWETLSIAPRIKKPYVLVYSFGSCHLEPIARKLASEVGGIVVNINRGLPTIIDGKNVRNAYAPGPQEFLGLIDSAEIVVTNSFHGMAFSILLEKEFYGFANSYSGAAATNHRFTTLGENFGLSDHIFDQPRTIERKEIDYKKVQDAVIKLRSESLEYLKNAFR